MNKTELFNEAKQNWTTARAAYAAAKTEKAKASAFNDIQFWGGKMTAYECFKDWCK